MKIYLFVFLFTLFLPIVNISCQLNTDIQNDSFANKKVAVEILIHSITVQRTVYLNNIQHADFLSREMKSKINNDKFLLRMLISSFQDQDTVYSFEEIPYTKEVQTHTIIYDDGSTSSVIDEINSAKNNPLYILTQNQQDDNEHVVRTVVKDGYITGYNKHARQILKEPFEFPDMKPFVDTLQVYLEKIKHNKIKKINTGFFVGDNSESHEIMKILPCGNVQIQNIYTDNKDFSLQNKTVTELNQEMTKILSVDVFNNNQLVKRKIFSYEDNKLLKNYHRSTILNENPAFIESKHLTINHLGRPVLNHSIEKFLRNQTIFY